MSLKKIITQSTILDNPYKASEQSPIIKHFDNRK